jgi:hypothetical protein
MTRAFVTLCAPLWQPNCLLPFVAWGGNPLPKVSIRCWLESIRCWLECEVCLLEREALRAGMPF